jgi:hypothetical protein
MVIYELPKTCQIQFSTDFVLLMSQAYDSRAAAAESAYCLIIAFTLLWQGDFRGPLIFSKPTKRIMYNYLGATPESANCSAASK